MRDAAEGWIMVGIYYFCIFRMPCLPLLVVPRFFFRELTLHCILVGLLLLLLICFSGVRLCVTP